MAFTQACDIFNCKTQLIVGDKLGEKLMGDNRERKYARKWERKWERRQERKWERFWERLTN